MGTLLNVNVPMLPEDQIKGFQTTRLGLRVYRDRLDRRVDPRGRPYYWIGGETPSGIPEEGTDIGALTEGYVSITPLHLDLTAYNAIQGIGKWQLPVNNMITNQLLAVNHSLLER
jgi:5'-nucleotidase